METSREQPPAIENLLETFLALTDKGEKIVNENQGRNPTIMSALFPPKVTELKTFWVYKLVDGEWTFWMNARGKSAKQLLHSVWWRNKDKVPKENIKVCENFKKMET